MTSWTLLLAHHHPDERARCADLGGVAVCRRCLAAWPLALCVIAAGVAVGWPVAGPGELVALWSLPMAEYVAVHVGGRPYSARRTWVLGPLLGLALGRTLHRYLLAPLDPVTWAILGVAATVGGASAATYHVRVKNRESV